LFDGELPKKKKNMENQEIVYQKYQKKHPKTVFQEILRKIMIDGHCQAGSND